MLFLGLWVSIRKADAETVYDTSCLQIIYSTSYMYISVLIKKNTYIYIYIYIVVPMDSKDRNPGEKQGMLF